MLCGYMSYAFEILGKFIHQKVFIFAELPPKSA